MAGWEAGNAEGCAASAAAGCESSSLPQAAAAVPKACPQGGDKSEQVDKANGAPAAAGCESSSPAASAAAVPKACPQGGDKSEQVGKANGALQRRAAKEAALPQAGRSDAAGGASETLKQTNSN